MITQINEERPLPLRITVVCALACAVLACNSGDDDGGSDTDTVIDDPTDPNEFVGLWRFVSFTVDGTTYTADEDPAIHGDAQFMAKSTSTGELDVRLMFTEDGLMNDSDVQTITIGCDIEAERWIFDEDGSIRVMKIEIDADTITFTWDESAEENDVDSNDPGGPSSMVLKRAPQMPSTLVGDWELVRANVSGKKWIGGECEQAGDSKNWQIVTAEIAISDRHLMEETFYEDTYSDEKCEDLIESSAMIIRGYIDERDGEADVWMIFDDEPGEMISMDLEKDGDNIVWTTKSCLPMPDCANGFESAVIRPDNS